VQLFQKNKGKNADHACSDQISSHTYLVKLGNLPDEPLEGHLPNEQLGALLILANFTARK